MAMETLGPARPDVSTLASLCVRLSYNDLFDISPLTGWRMRRHLHLLTHPLFTCCSRLLLTNTRLFPGASLALWGRTKWSRILFNMEKNGGNIRKSHRGSGRTMEQLRVSSSSTNLKVDGEKQLDTRPQGEYSRTFLCRGSIHLLTALHRDLTERFCLLSLKTPPGGQSWCQNCLKSDQLQISWISPGVKKHEIKQLLCWHEGSVAAAAWMILLQVFGNIVIEVCSCETQQVMVGVTQSFIVTATHFHYWLFIVSTEFHWEEAPHLGHRSKGNILPWKCGTSVLCFSSLSRKRRSIWTERTTILSLATGGQQRVCLCPWCWTLQSRDRSWLMREAAGVLWVLLRYFFQFRLVFYFIL